MSIALHTLSVPEIQALCSLEAQVHQLTTRSRWVRGTILTVVYLLVVSLGTQSTTTEAWLETLFAMIIAGVGMLALFGLGSGHGKSGALVICGCLGGCIYGLVFTSHWGALWGAIGVGVGICISTVMAYSTVTLLENLEDDLNSLLRQQQRVLSHLKPEKAAKRFSRY